MKRTTFHAIVSIVVFLCASSAFFGQNNPATYSSVSDKYLISAKAGGVNYLEGSVTITRPNGTSGVLLRRDRVEIGDRVTTGADGRAEILLNPGSYVRLGKNSSFEFGSTDLEDLKVTLDSGSAIFEVFAVSEFRVSVSTPKGKTALIETGIYRFDISTDGSAVVSVTKGKAEIGDDERLSLKDGRTATIGTEAVAVAKFDKGKRDELGEWSRTRSKQLANAASSLNDRNLGLSLLNGFNRGYWSLYDSFGLWVYNPQYGGHCFLPFSGGFRSPYGFWYDNWIYWNRMPVNYTPTRGGVNPTNGSNPGTKVSTRGPRSTGNGDVTPTGKISTREGTRETRDTIEPPPFTKIGRGNDRGAFGGGTRNSDSPDRSYQPQGTPTFSAPAPPPVSVPVYSAPSGKVSTRDNR